MTPSTTHSTPQSPHSAEHPPLTPPPKERRRLREGKSMTVKQLAAVVGVTQSTVKGWETGHSRPRGRKGEQYLQLLAVFAKEVAAAEAAEDAAEAEREAAERAESERLAVERQREQLESVRLAAEAAASGTSPALPSGSDTTRPDARSGGNPESGPEGTSPAPPPAATASEPEPAPASGSEPGSEPGSELGAESGSESGADPGTELATVPRPFVVLPRVPLDPDAVPLTPFSPEGAFDALYAYLSPALVRQAYLLTGNRALARESVERAFQLAWRRWSEVAADRDPASWLRAAAHEYALSPWHWFRVLTGMSAALPAQAARIAGSAEPAPVQDGHALHGALLTLPPAYRRALLLYDGLGLDLPDAAAEAEASTPATANRVLHARETIAERLPELGDTALLHERLDGLARAVAVPETRPPRAVRRGCEVGTQLWTQAAIVFTALIVAATVFTVMTAPREYIPPEAPGETVTGVAVLSGPQALTPEDVKLHARLAALPLNGPERLLPLPE